MYSLDEMEHGTPIMATLKLVDKHNETWRDKSEWYWLWRLFQEFMELFGALAGIHKDPVKWELMQIAAICMNWMNMRESKHVEAA